ncbi:nucleotide exchange factor GrpE [Mycoplasma sp. CSL7503-lung]|uniref:nucleotide exchange factor GrpE n=1 Tax=Mycoplasma sp. CSL7503-lung TaxID=536372 RepID=UPI0021CF8081|nr:nucleotide exchange factor GrpE [Mycoplasma sp. CSL7503-lung]MCU4706846.1 nucleotide exchange factor GrpE [Mycoplasma sp. CSL7503-lung]
MNFKKNNKHRHYYFRDWNIIEADFEVFLNEESLPEFKIKKQITLGKNEYIEGLEVDKFIIGLSVKKEVELSVSVPEDFKNKTIAGNLIKIYLKNIKLINYDARNLEILKLKKVEERNLELEKRLLELENKLKINEAIFVEKAKQLSQTVEEKIAKEKEVLFEKAKKEKDEVKSFVLQGFLEDFINPFNNFVMAQKVAENSENDQLRNYAIGFNIVIKQMIDVLESNNAELIIPTLNTEFDPNTQQVVDVIQTNNQTDNDNQITKVVRYGVKLSGRVITPASVVINKKISN